MDPSLEVDVDLDGQSVHVGTAHFTRRGRGVTTTFSYSPTYLARPDAWAIDPALPIDTGRGHTVGLPGAFADSAPDRWGRRLIEKAWSGPPSISEVDYLVGVSDHSRQGALRYRRPGERRVSRRRSRHSPAGRPAPAPGRRRPSRRRRPRPGRGDARCPRAARRRRHHPGRGSTQGLGHRRRRFVVDREVPPSRRRVGRHGLGEDRPGPSRAGRPRGPASTTDQDRRAQRLDPATLRP